MNPQNISDAIAGKDTLAAIETISEMLLKHPDDASLLTARGKLHWRAGHRAEAITDYTAADRLEPNGPARLLLEHTTSIMDFFNPDLLNP